MTPTTICHKEIESLSKKQRVNIVNALPGVRPVVLVGTVKKRVKETDNLKPKDGNLAVFSSLVHLGSDPALFGIFVRPEVNPKTPDTKFERQTLQNIRKHGYFTVNHIPIGDVETAHQCSAPYKSQQSEFIKSDLPCEYFKNIPAPFVESSPLAMALEFVREEKLGENGVVFVVGALRKIRVLEDFDKDHEYLLHPQHMGTVGVFGLGSYCRIEEVARLPKARV